jgi:hypothetical protein
VRFGVGDGSIWWHNLNQIRSRVGITDARWSDDNIIRKVGEGRSTLFWEDPWLDEVLLARSFRAPPISRLHGEICLFLHNSG